MNDMNQFKVIENDLVPVYETSTGEKVVYGTELHKVLGVATPYRIWVNRRFSDCDATENEDYTSEQICTVVGGTPKKEHIIKLDIAKEMAMMEKNNKGKQVRRYFIEVEKKYKAIKEEVTRENQLILSIINTDDKVNRVAALAEYKQTITKPLIERIEQQSNKLEQQKPFVEFSIIVQDAKGAITMDKMAALLSKQGVNIGRNNLFKFLRSQKILKDNNIPYRQYIEAGCFKVAEAVKENHYNAKSFITTLITGKGQILISKKVNNALRDGEIIIE